VKTARARRCLRGGLEASAGDTFTVGPADKKFPIVPGGRAEPTAEAARTLPPFRVACCVVEKARALRAFGASMTTDVRHALTQQHGIYIPGASSTCQDMHGIAASAASLRS